MSNRIVQKARSRWTLALALLAGLSLTSLASAPALAQDANGLFAASSLSKLVAPDELRAAFAANTAARQRVIITYRAVTPSVPRNASPATQDAALRTANASAAAALVSRVLGSASAPRSGGGGAPHNAKAMEFTPNVVIRLTPAEINAFAADADVVSIQLDSADPPIMDVSTAHVGMPFTWAAGGEGTGRTVAVLDTGVKREHEFLGTARVVYEACYGTNDGATSSSLCPGGLDTVENQPGAAADCLESVADGCSHGTHVGGTMVGFNTNRTAGEPAKGMAPKASLIAMNVFSLFPPAQCGSSRSCVLSYRSDQIDALNRVYALRTTYSIDSVNMSLGGGQFRTACDTDARKPVIDLLRAAGIATVIAAGNNGFDFDVNAPGCISTAVTVAASNRNEDLLPSFSNWGNLVDLVAPGVGIISSVVGSSVGDVSSYDAYSGTSMATPHVAGAFAALKSCAPTKTVDEIEAALKSTGVGISWVSITKPRINVAAAAKALGCRVPVTVTVSSNRNPAQSGSGQTPTHTATVTSPVPVTLGTLRIKSSPINNPTIVFTETDPTAPAVGTTKQFAHTIDSGIASTNFRVWAEIAATDDHAAATAIEFIQVITPPSATITPNLVFQVKDISTAGGATSTSAPLGEAVTLSVTVSDPSPSPTTPTGSVTIFKGTTAIHTGTLNASGVFSVSNSSLALGAHSLSATYGGNSVFLGRISPSLTLNVTEPPPKVSTTTSLSVVPPSTGFTYTFGMPITLRAVVSGNTPTGLVRFFDGVTELGSATLSNQFGAQIAELTTRALRGGNHTLSAVYAGSTNHLTSTSSDVPLFISPGRTTTTLTVPAVGLPGATPTAISARVAPVAPATVTPTGSVEFRRNGVLISTTALVNGVASLNLTNSPFGFNSIAARYLPTTDYAFSDAAAKTILITYALGASEFRVPSSTAFNQNMPSAAKLGAGAVVAFLSQSALNGPFGVRFRIISAAGLPTGAEGLVALPAAGIGAPHVAGLTNGDFVVTWQQTSGALARDIFARRFAPTGVPRGAAFKVNTVTAGDQLNPQVAALPSGRFVIVWQSPSVDGNGIGIAQRRYQATGVAAGVPTVVNSTTLGNQTNPVIATLADGTLGVAFVSRATSTAPIRFLWRAFRPTGVPAFTDATGDGSVFPTPPTIAITALSPTRFAMAWDRNETAALTSNRDVFMARYTPAGARDGVVTRVNPTQAGNQFDPSIAAFSVGRFVVGYTGPDPAPSTGIDAQNFTSTGARANVPFFLNQTAANRQYQLSLAPLGGGTNVLGVWTSTGQDGSADGVFGRLIRAP